MPITSRKQNTKTLLSTLRHFLKYMKKFVKISDIIGQTFSSQSVNEQNHLKAKLKSYNGKIITGIYDRKCLKKALIVSVWQ